MGIFTHCHLFDSRTTLAQSGFYTGQGRIACNCWHDELPFALNLARVSVLATRLADRQSGKWLKSFVWLSFEESTVFGRLFERGTIWLRLDACWSSFGNPRKGSAACESCAFTRQIFVHVISVRDPVVVCDLASGRYFCRICWPGDLGTFCIWIPTFADPGLQSISHWNLEIAGWNRKQFHLQLRAVRRGISLSTPCRRMLGEIFEDPSVVTSSHGGQLLLRLDTFPGLWCHSDKLHREGTNCRGSQRPTCRSQFAGHRQMARGDATKLRQLYGATEWWNPREGKQCKYERVMLIYVVLCFFESLQWTWIPLDFVVTVDFFFARTIIVYLNLSYHNLSYVFHLVSSESYCNIL